MEGALSSSAISLRTTGLEPAQSVLQVPARRVVQRCSHCSRASILPVVDGLPTSTPDGSGPVPQAVGLSPWGMRSPRLSPYGQKTHAASYV
jgi:hypothetical protein